MKFQPLFRVCLIFTHTILRTSKSNGNNTMKKMLPLLRYSVITGRCSNRRLLFKTTGSSKNAETIAHHFFVSELGRRKLSMQPKFVAAQKMLLKQKPINIRKWIARFYYFRYLYSAGSVCIAHNNCMSCPSIWATLSALLINILLGSFQLFLHSDQPL